MTTAMSREDFHDPERRWKMKRNWLSAFLAGFLAGVFALGAALTLIDTSSAVAQLPEMPHEQIQIMREMAAALRGIEQAVRQKCP